MTFPTRKLVEVSEINPRRPGDLRQLPDSYLVTFIPMPAVNAGSGEIDNAEIRPFGEVRKGFTYFSEEDVIFAKITPCMQNGKSAIARGLSNQLGFGSTEFHVVRPFKDLIIPEWIHYFLRRNSFLTEAMRHFQGAVGQQRVPSTFLGNSLIPVPPLEEQRRIVARINQCMERVEEIESLRSDANEEREALFESALNKRFKETVETSEVKTLEEVAAIRGGASLPKGASDRQKNFVLLVKVAEMNLPDNERVVSVSRQYADSTIKPKAVIQPGAIIFPKRGGAIATNKKRILGEPAYIDPNLMAIEAAPGILDPTFLYYWSRTLDLSSISNGGVIPQLNRKDLAPLRIPVPALDDQERLAQEFKILETYCFQLFNEFSERNSEVNQLRDSILRKAFAGEL